MNIWLVLEQDIHFIDTLLIHLPLWAKRIQHLYSYQYLCVFEVLYWGHFSFPGYRHRMILWRGNFLFKKINFFLSRCQPEHSDNIYHSGQPRNDTTPLNDLQL